MNVKDSSANSVFQINTATRTVNVYGTTNIGGSITGLTPSSVGLGNVLNVTQEPAITAGTTSQWWRGDKTWTQITSLGTQTAGFSMGGYGISGIASLYNATGIVGSPTYSFTNATTSGMYLSAANQISIGTAGQEGLRVPAAILLCWET